jgi:outer membrane murein-binding lipoprotein Lpp
MKLSVTHWLIIAVAILALATGVSTYKLIQVSERAESLEAATKIYEKDFEDLQQEKYSLIDSIEKIKKNRAKEIEARDQKISDLLVNIDGILATIPKKEKEVDSMAPYEVEKLHDKYYPNPATAKADAVKKAQRVEVLEVAITQQGIVISEQAGQISSFKQQLSDSELQNDLQQELNQNLQTQLEAEKAKKPKNNTLLWVLRCIGALGAGYFAGNVL